MKENVKFRRTFFPISQVLTELAGWVLSIEDSLPLSAVGVLSMEDFFSISEGGQSSLK